MSYSIKIIVFFACVLFVPANVFAQMEEVDHSEEVVETLDYKSPFVSMLAKNNSIQTQPVVPSHVFIQQIGNSNTVRSTIISEDSEAHYTQKGNFNSIHTEVIAKKVDQLVLQHGDNNHATYLDYTNPPESSLNLEQTGGDNYFTSYGSNSISNGLQFRMTGDAETIIVKNYQ